MPVKPSHQPRMVISMTFSLFLAQNHFCIINTWKQGKTQRYSLTLQQLSFSVANADKMVPVHRGRVQFLFNAYSPYIAWVFLGTKT